MDEQWHEADKLMLNAVAQQLSQRAENLRLFEQTRRRAGREQITREIIDKIRGSRDIETALKTTTEELNKALGTDRSVVNLNIADLEDIVDES